MTAFARRDHVGDSGALSWELRSVNHRYLDLSMRLPDEMRRFEPRFRAAIGKALSRGRIDATLKVVTEGRAEGVEIDEATVRGVLDAAARVCDLAPSLTPLRVVDVLRWPGAVVAPEVDLDRLGTAAEGLLVETLRELVDTRRREGERLAEVVLERLDALEIRVGEVRARLPGLEPFFRERLDERLADLRRDLDPSRLEQEIVLFLHKSDVVEELDRLNVHAEEIRRTVGGTGPVGRRLDFLMQELNREANTLGSKAASAELSQDSVEIKVLIEQMREQIQNIE